MRKLTSILLICLTIQAIAQQKSILFLGNSYTATSNLPSTLYNLAAAGGDTIIHDRNTPGGYTLEGHSTNSTSLNKIASRDWDFVVLQEQSQKPSFPPAQVAAETYPFAEVLVDSIKSNYECSEPIFFMTWGRRDGDQNNCQFYPPLCTFEGMNARLRESYIEMGFDNEATVAPCGAAWKHLSEIDNASWLGLYNGDGSHPSAHGTYLNACIFYSTIFRQSPVGIPYYANIGQQDAGLLQQLAEDIVIDSLENWNIGHQDAFGNANYSIAGGLTVNFSAETTNSDEYLWDFGDMETSTELNPQHAYSMAGTYDVSFIASSNCDADTTTFQIIVDESSLSVEDSNYLENIEISTNQDYLQVNNVSANDLNASIFGSQGKVVFIKSIPPKSISRFDIQMLNGIFMVTLEDGNNRLTRRFVQVR